MKMCLGRLLLREAYGTVSLSPNQLQGTDLAPLPLSRLQSFVLIHDDSTVVDDLGAAFHHLKSQGYLRFVKFEVAVVVERSRSQKIWKGTSGD